MRWEQHGGWRPVLISPIDTPDALADALHDCLTQPHKCETCGERHSHASALCVGDDLALPAEQFRQTALSFRAGDREAVAFLAAFGSDAVMNSKKQSVIQDTAFRTMSGAGHQHFLKFARNICSACTRDHIKRDLFETWRYADPVQNHTLRLDPLDDARYALRWSDPSGDPTRQQRGSVYGANRLAIEALPLFACVPRRGILRTIGFVENKTTGVWFRWPIWTQPLSLDAVRSLLTLSTDPANASRSEALRARGVVESFESRRLTVGKFRCFSPARPV
ncbi:MAG: hypothetical protein LC135_09895 [Phycisphaerae bacterium]|jgi:hypothetical protein|nr:hypothetical protein [Phycisphaerae bacterium]MCZ2400159.1 hypothetical protein [Phycisphaerae bacterium]